MREVQQKIGRPDNSMWIRRCIIYGIILAIMLFGAPFIFQKIMVPMAADGILGAWYAIFVPITLVIMAIGLFRCWRRRWSLAYVNWYRQEAEACGYRTCPRCGSRMVIKHRTRSSREKVGEVVTTTTYANGTQTVNSEGIYENVSHTDEYHECTYSRCQLEPEQHIGQSHLPWTVAEIRCLVLNDESALKKDNTCAKHLLLSRLLLPIVALVIVAVGAFSVYAYADSMSGEWTHTTADKEASRSMDEFEDHLLSLDTEYASWSVHYEKSPSDMINYFGSLFFDQSTGYGIQYYGKGDEQAYIFQFKGTDADTGLPNGEYILIKLDGIPVLIDDENQKIYKQGTEYYDTHAPKLLALTHDAEIRLLFEQVDGGEHALSGFNDFWMEFARKDHTMIYSYLADTTYGNEFRAITTHPDEMVTEKWYFTYRNDDFVYTPDLDGFVYSDAAPEEIRDQLDQLIADSSDGTGSYQLYRDDDVVMDIYVETLPNGYQFTFDEAENGFEENAVYVVNVNLQTLTKITVDENYAETKTDMPLSEYQDQYDFLLSIVPERYIRNILDLEKAETRKENLGLVTIYGMKDENGNVTAEMKVALGKIGEVIHYISDHEYAKIELTY